MFNTLKLILLLFSELFFDSEEEYNLKSRKFNARKVAIFFFVMMSLAGNVWMVFHYLNLAERYVELRKTYEEKAASAPAAAPPTPPPETQKNPQELSSDSAAQDSSLSHAPPLDYNTYRSRFYRTRKTESGKTDDNDN